MSCSGCEFEARISFTPRDDGQPGWEKWYFTKSSRTLPSGLTIEVDGEVIDLGNPEAEGVFDGECHVTASGCVEKEVCSGDLILPVLSLPDDWTMVNSSITRMTQEGNTEYDTLDEITNADTPTSLTLSMKDPACGALTMWSFKFENENDQVRARLNAYVRCKPCEGEGLEEI